ncbi:MAG: hypothetical protein ABR500_00340 [Dermatophilaceae bacterium]
MARWRPEILLVALVLVVSAPIVQTLMAHQASRLALTAAVWDRGTIQIDAYEDILGVDFAERDGHLYSDKAPGQPFLAAPFYGAARAVGAEPAEVERYFNNRTLWWTSLWSATIPLAALAVMMRRFALRVVGDERAATAAAVGMSLGTLLLPFSTVLFSHVLTAALVFGAYLVGRDRNASSVRLAVAGLLGGLAVVTEYTAAIVVVVLGVLILHRHGRKVIAYVAGGLPAVAVLAFYNAVAWGSPTSFSYANSGKFSKQHAQGLFGIRIPDPVLTAQVLLGERGLLTLTPIVLVGVVGLVWLTRRRRTREVGIVGLVVFATFVAVQGGWFSVTAGSSPGPRYVVPALPFVAVGVAEVWRRSRAAVVIAAAIGALSMLMAIFTNPLAKPSEDFTAGHWAWRMASGRWGDTLLSPYLDDPWAQLVQLCLAAVLLVLLCVVTAQRTASETDGPATLHDPDERTLTVAPNG